MFYFFNWSNALIAEFENTEFTWGFFGSKKKLKKELKWI